MHSHSLGHPFVQNSLTCLLIDAEPPTCSPVHANSLTFPLSLTPACSIGARQLDVRAPSPASPDVFTVRYGHLLGDPELDALVLIRGADGSISTIIGREFELTTDR